MASPKVILQALRELVDVFGEPRTPMDRLARGWSIALRDLPDELVPGATATLTGMDVYGWPKPADRKTAADGRGGKGPEGRGDCWGGKYTGEGAIRWHEVRVPVDFVGELTDIDLLPPEVKEHQERLKSLESAQLPLATEQPRRLR